MRITAKETEIKGSWVVENGAVAADSNCHRIDWLTTNVLQRINSDSSGWDILYQSPDDGRYWELTYPESGSHGGGPPTLRNVTEEMTKTKYKMNKDT